LGTVECCVFLQPVNACVEWSLDPPGAGTMTVLPFVDEPFHPSLLVTVSPEAPHGTVLTVRADVESGRRILEELVYVYTPEGNPLVGWWVETFRTDCSTFIRGEVDESGRVDLADPIAIFTYLFLGPPLQCLEAANTNGDGTVDIADGVYLLTYLFAGGRTPPAPFPECGVPADLRFGCVSAGACPTVDAVPPARVEELVFEASGSFRVTWFPFEVYVDYWGTYTFDVASGSLSMTITGGNYIPPDFTVSPQSAFSLDGDSLRLKRLYLGSHEAAPGPRCDGHLFERL
jgi:hypothetical protein